MPDEKVKVFISSGCGPCQEVRKMIEEGKFNLADVDLIDVSSEEGFPFVEKMGLTKVPAAFKGGKACKIMSDEESLIIDCGEDEPTEGQET